MSIQTALSLFLDEYPKAIDTPFRSSAMAEFIRNDVPETLALVIGDNPRYVTHGSPGQGNWAKAPWAAIYDRFITESAQDGYYIVYLVREDFSGIYISLNQGITAAKKQYGTEAKSALRVRASDYLARLGPLPPDIQIGPIDLASTTGASLSSHYEVGAICSKYYARETLPNDDSLNADLRKFVDLYLILASSEAQLFERADVEDDERDLVEEDLRQLREHKRIERNRKLANQAKQVHGYVCSACGFNFEKIYGDIGRKFIEAHHLMPVSKLKGQRVALNPKSDFAVLCSNCHRMIHRTMFVDSVREFRAHYLTKQQT